MVSKITRFLTLALGVLLLQACSADSIEPAEGEGMEFLIVMRVPLGSKVSHTRADYNTDYTDGQGTPIDGEDEGLDYTILENDLRLLFFNASNGTFVEEANIAEVTRHESQSDFVNYHIRGHLTKILAGDHNIYRAVALANLRGQLPLFGNPNFRGSEMLLYETLAFDFKGDDVAYEFTQNNWSGNEAGRVPMWGKATAQLSAGQPVNITMLRALSKVRVELSPAVKTLGYRITGIELKNANDRGFIAPYGAVSATQTSTCTNLSISVNIPSSAAALTESQRFMPIGEKWYTYLPETKNRGVAEEQRPYMLVKMDRTVPGSHVEYKDLQFELEFGDYEPVETYAGTRFDVQRNHYYQYVITGLDLADAKLKYEVCDWNRYSTEIFFN